MNAKQRRKFDEVPLLSAILTAIAYLIFFIYQDYFPMVDKITIFQEADKAFWNLPAVINLPWHISRLWDIPTIFLLLFSAITLIKYLDNPKHRIEESYVGALLGLLFGLVIGLWFFIKGGLGTDIKTCFIIGTSLSGLISFTIGFSKSFMAGLRFSLLVSITTSLLIGLLLGLKTGFVISLAMILIVSLEMMILVGACALIGGSLKYIFSEKFADLIDKILKNELN